MKVIEGEYRVLSEDGLPIKKRWRRGPLYLLTHPVIWMLVAFVSFVGLTEGW